MASDISTIQSLKAVDAWIDVINANINGGVRTAFKASRLTFGGSNTDVSRAGTSTSLPLQFPEPGLTTANTVIDFSQGAITASTETTHLAIQGDGFFMLADPNTMDPTTGLTVSNPNARFYFTRDGEFHTDAHGLLVHSSGYYLVRRTTRTTAGVTVINYDTGSKFGASSQIRAIYNDIDGPDTTTAPQRAIRLSDFVARNASVDVSGTTLGAITPANVIAELEGGFQSLTYSPLGSTVFDFGFTVVSDCTTTVNIDQAVTIGTQATSTILTKSLEASNASMTQSVPELSLAQKLFSALTKVLQTRQTNVDGVLNLVR